MDRPWLWILALSFAGCPMEVKCVTTDPRPSPASLEQANAELVGGLARCGYLSTGRRGEISLIRPGTGTDASDPCLWECVGRLRDDCEALGTIACRNEAPDGLGRCARSCTDCVGTRCAAAPLQVGLPPSTDPVTALPAKGFACVDGSGLVDAVHVCDSVEDCLDGSDEAAALGCARLRCDRVEDDLEP